MYLIAGLGNPGKKYENTYHNLGFMAIDALSLKLGANFNKEAFGGLTATLNYGGEKVILLKPLTYMNLSGDSISAVMNFYKIPEENLIVLYDDTDIPKAALRIRDKGSAGTHNGMRDIVLKLKSQNFKRIRIGSRQAAEDPRPLVDYVLSEIPESEKAAYKATFSKAADAAIAFIKGESTEKIQSLYNGNI